MMWCARRAAREGAFVGAVRADYFAGTGPQAGELASRVNQPLRLWVLWPK